MAADGPTDATNPDLDLSGRRALVTGASRGIGYAIAERLARNGARVALASRRREGLEDAAARIDAACGGETMVLTANVSQSDEAERLVPAVIAAWGGIDILVNNAGSNPVFGPLIDLDEHAWDKTLATNVKGPFLLSRAAGRWMCQNHAGAIVNVASVGGVDPSPMLGAYSVSKAAVIMLTKVLAAELGPHGVRVNCVAPGLVETRFAAHLVNTPEIHDAIVSRAALRRHGQPDEISGAVHFLVSDAASYMTGQVMIIDGGTRY
jgi:NAD(P)-dependent dehydrogenase (short-subunit alcohol dehydrogenase family)